ncbi:polysaccharide deacetylase family protein [Streptomyces tubercidicus]
MAGQRDGDRGRLRPCPVRERGCPALRTKTAPALRVPYALPRAPALRLLCWEHGWVLSRAAFFLINEYASQYPGTVETLRKTGPYVGNHTWSHPHLPQLSEQDMRTEITEGIPSTLLRPPYGDLGERETRVASELGYRMCTWTIDPLDWDGPGGLPDRVPDPCGGEGRPGGGQAGRVGAPVTRTCCRTSSAASGGGVCVLPEHEGYYAEHSGPAELLSPRLQQGTANRVPPSSCPHPRGCPAST